MLGVSVDIVLERGWRAATGCYMDNIAAWDITDSHHDTFHCWCPWRRYCVSMTTFQQAAAVFEVAAVFQRHKWGRRQPREAMQKALFIILWQVNTRKIRLFRWRSPSRDACCIQNYRSWKWLAIGFKSDILKVLWKIEGLKSARIGRGLMILSRPCAPEQAVVSALVSQITLARRVTGQ